MQLPWLAIGLMSGTSADGIDAALIQTDGESPPRLLAFQSHPYPAEVRQRVLALQQPGPGEIDRLGELDRDLGDLFAQAALEVCVVAGVTPDQVAVIGSHGQTVRHRPPLFSLQIGNPFRISAATGITTVADFRPADMARGGEGAPLAPLFHQGLFHQPGRHVAVVNLGGIANLTALHAAPEKPLLAGDTGPANTLLDHLAARVSGGREVCDRDGRRAASGQVDAQALAWLMSHPYLERPLPKSTGQEMFGPAFLDQFLQRFPHLSVPDQFATLTRFTAASVARAACATLPPAPHNMILCGGGAHNPELVRHLADLLPVTTIQTSRDLGVDPDALEAQAFAWFAVRTLRGLPSSHPGATNATQAAILGAIHPGKRALNFF
ncbi:MAG: anhydro-N-acetylmuramic acid kinase [Magnetococcales bacterium]|nr:anhydro-N-acetylmuramic acid kinase [Magnetococcales bacterium]MBF0323187.1 anhydro-N-acetylmuramic acid kinase [Magnetococcales bacterium]